MKISLLHTESLLRELRKITAERFTEHQYSTKVDILVDVRFFPISYAEMQVLRLDRVDYFHFNQLRNYFCQHMLDRASLLESFCVDAVHKLHVLACRSMLHCLMFAAEFLEVINEKLTLCVRTNLSAWAFLITAVA